jgi:hypothetical protein
VADHSGLLDDPRVSFLHSEAMKADCAAGRTPTFAPVSSEELKYRNPSLISEVLRGDVRVAEPTVQGRQDESGPNV